MACKNTRFKLILGEGANVVNATDVPRKTTGFCLACNGNVRVHQGAKIEAHVEHFNGEGQECPLASCNNQNKKIAA